MQKGLCQDRHSLLSYNLNVNVKCMRNELLNRLGKTDVRNICIEALDMLEQETLSIGLALVK